MIIIYTNTEHWTLTQFNPSFFLASSRKGVGRHRNNKFYSGNISAKHNFICWHLHWVQSSYCKLIIKSNVSFINASFTFDWFKEFEDIFFCSQINFEERLILLVSDLKIYNRTNHDSKTHQEVSKFLFKMFWIKGDHKGISSAEISISQNSCWSFLFLLISSFWTWVSRQASKLDYQSKSLFYCLNILR